MTKKAYDQLWRRTNREKCRLYVREWRKCNPTKVKESAATMRQEAKARLHNLKNKPCFDCQKQLNPWQMQFDHRPGEQKLFNICTNYHVNLDRLLKEIAKCDLVCANCHAERTYQRLQEKGLIS